MDEELARKLEEHRKLSRLGLVTPANQERDEAVARIAGKLTELHARCTSSEQFDFLTQLAQVDGMQQFEEKLDGMLAGLADGTLTLDALDRIRQTGGTNRAARRRADKLRRKLTKQKV